MASLFTQGIKRSTDLRYNLWWSFGSFLEDVPRRLGANEALDRAADAVATAHASFCAGRVGSVDALTKYSRALRTLRVYLEDGVHAQSSNTLCAVMILLVCQIFLGPTTQSWSGHAEGAAQILKARRHFGPRDPFEQKLFMSLRGSVVCSPPLWSIIDTPVSKAGASAGVLRALFGSDILTISSCSRASSTTESTSPRMNGTIL